jgi:hypothetical protein
VRNIFLKEKVTAIVDITIPSVDTSKFSMNRSGTLCLVSNDLDN